MMALRLSSITRKPISAKKVERRDADFYPTPRHAIEVLLEEAPPLEGVPVLEPAAGDGAIVKRLIARGHAVVAVELRPEAREDLAPLCAHPPHRLVIADWLKGDEARWTHRWPMAIVTNPPFSIAREFAEACLATEASYVALLLRINVEASRPWRSLWQAHPWTRRVPLWKRPSFTGDGRTDGANYCWFIWDR